jgi:thiol-disulfide isomerase/thioredoxin
MNKYILTFFCIAISIIISGCSVVESPEQKQKTQELIEKARSSKVTVVDIHHDGCEPCKFIKPIFQKLESKYDSNKDIAFLTYDLSNPFKASKSIKIAKELGLEKIYKAQRYTGVVLILDTKTKVVLDTLIAEDNEQKYIDAIESQIGKDDK